MKILAQDGYGPSDKLITGFRHGVIDGAIFSARYRKKEKFSDKVEDLEHFDGDFLLDPEFYAYQYVGKPNAKLGSLESWDYFNPPRRPLLISGQGIRPLIENAYREQAELSRLSTWLAPNVYIDSANSIDAGIALNFISQAKSCAESCGGSQRPVYASLVLDRDVFSEGPAFMDLLNALTAMQNPPDGFYVLVGSQTVDEDGRQIRSDLFHDHVIAGWMLVNYILSINGFHVINGCCDLLSPLLGICGAYAGASGWFASLRQFSMGRYIKPNSKGGATPLIRYISSALLARVTHDDYRAYNAINGVICNGLPSDQPYSGEPTRTDHHAVRWWPRRRNGRLYLVSDAGHAGIVRVDPDEGRLVPVAAAGPVAAVGAEHPLLRQAAEIQHLPLNLQSGFSWTDANGNGRIDPEEIRLVETAMPQGVLQIDDHWNVIWRSRYWRAETPEPAWMEMRNMGDALAEQPAWSMAAPSAALLPDAALGLLGSGTDALWRDAAGATVLFMNGNRAGGDRHGDVWPTMSLGSARLMAWRPDGTLDWVVGKAAVDARYAPDRPHDPAAFHEPTGIPGSIRGNLVVADKSFAPATVFASDGLYAGSFLDHRTDDGLPDAVYVWWRDRRTEEDSPIPYDTLRGGSVIEHAGRVYWFPMGNQYTPVYEITGWDAWHRAEGQVSAPPTPPDPGQGTGMIGQVFANSRFEGPPMRVHTPRLWCVPGPAGRVPEDRVDWSAGPTEGIDGHAPFSIRWNGRLEALFTEPWRLTVYNHDTRASTQGPGWDRSQGTARVWLGESLVVDTNNGQHRGRWVMLDAGRMYDLRVEMTHTGTTPPEFSLCWESTTQERQRIPTGFLHPKPFAPAGTLSMTIDNAQPANGEIITLRLASSVPVNESLDVRIAVEGTSRALRDSIPSRLTIPSGRDIVEHRIRWNAKDQFARLAMSIEPTAGWTVDPDRHQAVLLTGVRSDLFAFGSDETVLLADPLEQPEAWGIRDRTGQFENGVFGPTVPSNGRAFRAWRSLPMEVDPRQHLVIFYLRARTPGQGHGGHVFFGLDDNWLGLRVVPMTQIGIWGRSSLGHSGANATPFDKDIVARQQAGETLDYRVAIAVQGHRMIARTAVLDPQGIWQPCATLELIDPRNSSNFLQPPPRSRLEMGGRNVSAGTVEAIAVAVGPLPEDWLPRQDLDVDVN